MEDKKTSTLAILTILKEQSDENHIIRQPKLLEMLESTYHIKLDRRTLYRNIDTLIDFGYDISKFEDNKIGYFLREREFEPSQVYLLCNAIHSSNFIPTNASKEIIDKLLLTQSKHFRNDYKSTVYVENKNKKENKEFFLSVEIIAEAIKNKQAIKFNYTQYDINKKLVNRRAEPYKLSPYYLIYINEKTYLVGKSPNHDDLTHFRIDRMKNVETTNDKYIKLAKNEDPYEYAKTKIYMFHGNDERIVIKCDMCILDNVIDIFGKDVTLEMSGKDQFKAYVKSSSEGMKHLAVQYLDHMEVLEPQELRESIKQVIKQASKKYK